MKHIGNLIIKDDCEMTALTEVTGWLDVCKGATLTAPALTKTSSAESLNRFCIN